MESGKFEYFIDQTNERLRIIDNKLDDILSFKWQIIGGSVVMSCVITIGIQLITWAYEK